MHLSKLRTGVLLLASVAHVAHSTYIPEPSISSREEIKTFVPFADFLKQVKSTSYANYKATNVTSESEFLAMQKHIMYMYNSVSANKVASFLLGNEYGDCIDIKEQPSFRHLKIAEIAQPPSAVTFLPKDKNSLLSGNSSYADSPLKLGLKDQFGNPISCPSNTIPMARLTLEKLTRYPTLADFFSKVPSEIVSKSPSKEFLPSWDSSHLHAYGRQSVSNFGGNSFLSLWNPIADFSLSQQWYVGGSGCSTQTVEGGWLMYPSSGKKKAVLFIYFTRHNYNLDVCDTGKVVGCYDLTCDGFVQTNNHWFLGGEWTHYSSIDGQQWGFEMQWKLHAGNWWLYLRGPGEYEAVGYYPISVFEGGQMGKQAQSIEYGGEVARKVGNGWPEMGSGLLAEGGWLRAAWQNMIYYTVRDEAGGVGEWADLRAVNEADPKCYSIDLTNSPRGGDWGTYFFFGGPGGSVC